MLRSFRSCGARIAPPPQIEFADDALRQFVEQNGLSAYAAAILGVADSLDDLVEATDEEVFSDRQLLSTALFNAGQNALLHGPPEGVVRIKARLDHGARLCVGVPRDVLLGLGTHGRVGRYIAAARSKASRQAGRPAHFPAPIIP